MTMDFKKVNKTSVLNIIKALGLLIIKNIDLLLFIGIIYLKLYEFNIGIKLPITTNFPLSAIGSLLILCGISTFFKKRTRIITLLIINFVLSIIFFADIVYYRYYNDIISIPVLIQARLADTALTGSILHLISVYDFFYFIDIILLIPLIIFAFRRVLKKNVVESIIKRVVSSIAVLLIGASFVTYGFYKLDEMMAFRSLQTVYDHGFFISNIGALNYHGYDIYFSLYNKFSDNSFASKEKKDEIASVLNKKEKQNSKTSILTNAAKGKNLIVIQVESMQNAVINRIVDGMEITPNLNRLIKDSIYSDRYYSQAAQGNTSDAEFITNNSYYALPEGAVYFRYPANTFDSIAVELKNKGYETAAFHAYKASYWNRSTIYPSLGFDRFISQKDFKLDDIRGGWGLSDKSFFRQSLEVMKQTKKPFYTFFVTLTSHYPFDAFKRTEYFDLPSYRNTFLGNYFECMHYADEALGSFIEGLKQDGLYDTSVIMIYGDHEAIKPQNLEEARKAFNLPQSNYIAGIEMKNIPFILHLPHNLGKGTRIAAGGQVDLLPTLANIMGFDANYSIGKDLLNTKENYSIFRDGSVTDGETIYLSHDQKYYDYKTGEQTEASKLKKYVDQTHDELNLSDTVIENNMIKYFNKK